MAVGRTKRWSLGVLAVLGSSVALAGCQTYHNRQPAIDLPHELRRMTGPPYVVEPPDVLQIDALDLVPKPPFKIKPLDSVILTITPALPGRVIEGTTLGVDPGGYITLPYGYGKALVAGMSLDDAAEEIKKLVKDRIRNVQVSVALATSRALQQVRGPHLVNQDGTISLGTYGSVTVAGLTVKEVKQAIELHLSQTLLNPEVSVIVIGYNSKIFYLIQDQAGNGYTVSRVPITGNETVLDALGEAGGLLSPASTRMVYIARPTPYGKKCEQIIPVDIDAIIRRADPTTNYQLLPGDRLFVKAQTLLTLENQMNKIFTPIERVFGVALLGVGAVESLETGSVGNFFGTTPAVGF
jgi:polysaccharide export outer membrane protein